MALTELECLERRKKITENLDADGCHYGELLSRTVVEIRKKLMSKVGGFETTAQLMLDLGKENKNQIAGIKKMTVDAIAYTHAAQQAVTEVKDTAEVLRGRFDRIAWKLLWIVLGGNGFFLAAYLIISTVKK